MSDAVAAWRERGLDEAEPRDDHVRTWRRRHMQDSHVWARRSHALERVQIRVLLRHLRWHRSSDRSRATLLAAVRPRDAASILRAEIRRYILLSAQLWLAMIWLGRRRRRLVAEGWSAAAGAMFGQMNDLQDDRVAARAWIKTHLARLPKSVSA